MFSSKITSYVTFPIDGVDLRPYVHKGMFRSILAHNSVLTYNKKISFDRLYISSDNLQTSISYLSSWYNW